MASATAFLALPLADRLKVVAFLDSLGRAEFDGNGDNVRNRLDLPGFLQARAIGTTNPDLPSAVYDYDQNGVVDNQDLAVFAALYEEDCNGNGISDLMDVLSGGSTDFNGNLVADECEFCQPNLGFSGAGTLAMRICGDDLTLANSRGAFELFNGPANALTLIAISATSNPTPIVVTETLVPSLPLAALVDFLVTDSVGRIRLPVFGGNTLPISTWVFQAAAFDGANWDFSNALQVTVGGF